MKIFHYHSVTKEYISTTLADPDPLDDGKWILPAYSTSVEPPRTNPFEIAVFNETDNHWNVLDDYRGKYVYNKSTKEEVLVRKIGPIDNHYSTLTPKNHDQWNGKKWVKDAELELSETKKKLIEEIVKARDKSLFDSSATVRTKDGIVWQVDPRTKSDLNDAITLFSAMGGTPTGFQWRDKNNRNHDVNLAKMIEIAALRAEQINQIWHKSWALKSRVESAKTVSELARIEIPESLT